MLVVCLIYAIRASFVSHLCDKFLLCVSLMQYVLVVCVIYAKCASCVCHLCNMW